MEEFIISLIVFGAVLVWLFLEHIKKVGANQRLKNFIAWCVTKNSSVYRCNLSLKDYLNNAQIDLKLLQEYCICDEEEWDMVNDILSAFQAHLVERYFCNDITIPITNGFYEMSKEECFMFFLQSWIESHQCDNIFLGYALHEKTIAYKSYGSWGKKLYDATYTMTKFGVLMNKVYYIAYVYCKNSKFLNPDGKKFNSEQTIEIIIDSKRISVSRM